MKTKRIIAALAAAVMLASNQSVAAGVSYAAEAIEESQIVYGEVNGDGKVGISDSVAILQFIANRDKYPLNAQALRNADCVDHGDGVTGMDAFALKLVDAKMLSLEEFPVTSQRIQECLNPPVEEDALFEEVYTFGVYNTETKAIDIKWLVNETVKEVEIFVSDDNKKYKSVAKVKDTDEYSYEVKEEFDTIFFKVAYNDKDGKLHESFPFFIVLKDGKYVTDFIDSDEDGVADMVESVYGSKIDSADSDEDGLSDYEEIYITQTDPTVRDSFKKGISDADADCDEDGISNLSEIKYGIDPLREDTDDDRLSDFVEINELKTDPLIRDTDEDGLTDYAERKMGLDPLKPKTGDVPDAEAVIQQEIDTDSFVLEAVNADADNKAYKLSVDIKTAGFAEEVVSASKSKYTVVIDEKAIAGDVVDIVINDGAEPESMKLNFSISDDYKENVLGTYTGLEGIKRLTVFQYNEDIHMLIPMDTEYSEAEGIVSADIDGAGTYCIVDAERWFNSIGIKPEKNVPEAPDTESLSMSSVADAFIGEDSSILRNDPFEIIFTIQRSGVGGEQNFIAQKKMILELARYLFKNYDDIVIHVVPYDIETRHFKLKGDKVEYDFTNVIELDIALDRIVYSEDLGPANRWYAYHNAQSELIRTYRFDNIRFVINLMNAETVYDHTNFGGSGDIDSIYNDIIQQRALFGEVYFKSSPNPKLKEKLVGDVLDVEFNPQTNYNEVLDYITRNIKTYNDFVMPFEASNIKVLLKGELSPDSDMDTDGDGIRDWDELDSNYVTINPDGTYNFMTFEEIFKKVRISGNTPSQWRNTSHGDKYDEHLSETTVAVWKSDPTKEDTEGDKIKDKDDGDTFGPIDDHFQVVEDASKVTYRDLLSTDYEAVWEEADNTFSSSKLDLDAMTTATILSCLSMAGKLPGSSTSAAMLYADAEVAELAESIGSLPNAASALSHYLSAEGTEFKLERFPYAIAYTCEGRNRYYNNMNSFMKMVESNAVMGHSYEFSTVKEINKPGDFNEQGGDTKYSWIINLHEYYNTNMNAAMDWWLAIGGSQSALTSSVECKKDDKGQTVYTAKIRYYCLDVYDWDKSDKYEKHLYHLHETGLAKAFINYGYYETEIEWVKGSRYPSERRNDDVLDEVTFEGISDTNLEKNKEAAELFYLLV